MTQHQGPSDVLSQTDEQPTRTPTLLKEADGLQTGVADTPSPKRRWLWFAGLAAAAVIVLGIAVGVASLRSGEVSQPPAAAPGEVGLQPADIHHRNQGALYRWQRDLDPADRHYFNYVRPQAARDVDAARFAGRYSDRAAVDPSDIHHRNRSREER